MDPHDQKIRMLDRAFAKWLILLAFVLSSASCTKTKLPKDQPARETLVSPAAVNLNTATAEELRSLPGIGPGIAASIVSHRLKFGKFRRPEHLMLVRGVSDSRYRALRNLIRAE